MIFVTSAISVLLLAVVCYGAFKGASSPDGPVAFPALGHYGLVSGIGMYHWRYVCGYPDG